MRRRQVLAALGTTTLASIAGCATIEAELGVRQETLGPVTIENTETEPFDVRLEVLRDGEQVHTSMHELSAVSASEYSPVVVNDWEDNPDARRWIVRAKNDGHDWVYATLDAARPENCHTVNVQVVDIGPNPIVVLPMMCPSG
ncbi:hypothetical protein [Halomarina oriensis]|uniref:Lipoprotein n=1 Tax=Halomarina oriensis TaxID=671145 RepID=A0A6B0GPG2_9EURY|nr:hypothetical protein [Halomarina oriensis]MWG36712.1 hypothetical protein [Halomarina oriensis]